MFCDVLGILDRQMISSITGEFADLAGPANVAFKSGIAGWINADYEFGISF
jgi:hypothetical protein